MKTLFNNNLFLLPKEIISKIKTIKNKGSFAQNFTYTFSGSILSFTVSLVLSPIFSRVYPPETYGYLSIFMALMMNISAVSFMGYNLAIILPKEEEKYYSLIRLTILLTFITTAVVLLITVFFNDFLKIVLTMDYFNGIFYFLGPTVFFYNLWIILSQGLIRNKEFKKVSFINTSTSIAERSISLSIGFISNGNVLGFIIGEFLNRLLSVVLLLNRQIIKFLRKIIYQFKIIPVINIAKEYKKYPLIVLPGEYIYLLSAQLPVYLISIYFNNKVLGYYSFAASILDKPMKLIGNALRPVYFQKASSLYNSNEYEKLQKLTLELYKYLFIICIIPFTILIVYGDIIFRFIFGENWLIAGKFAGILGYLYVFRLVSSPISSVLWILKKENVLTYFQILLFISRLLGFFIGIYFFGDILITLILFAGTTVVSYLILIFLIFKELKLNSIQIIFNTISSLIIVLSTLILIKIL